MNRLCRNGTTVNSPGLLQNCACLHSLECQYTIQANGWKTSTCFCTGAHKNLSNIPNFLVHSHKLFSGSKSTSNIKQDTREAVGSVGIFIPNTVVLKYQRPGVWWASDEHHGLHRLGSQHLNSNSVVEFLTQQALHSHQNLHARPPRLHPDIKPHPGGKKTRKTKAKAKPDAVSEGAQDAPTKDKLQDGVIVAQYMYVTGGAHGRSAGEQVSTELMTEYLDAKALQALMFERTKEHDGIIQQFIEPPGVSNSTIRARWSVSACIIEQSTSRVPLSSLQLAVPLRAATFDAKPGDSDIEPVRSSHVKQCINALVSSIVAAVRRTLPHAWSLFGLDLFFKMSAGDGAILFLFCANARVVHQTIVQPDIARPFTSATVSPPPPPRQLRLLAAKENTHCHRQLLDGFFDCPRCRRTFKKSSELSFKVSFRHIILAQMLRAPQNKPLSRAASPVLRAGAEALPTMVPRNQQHHLVDGDGDDDDDSEDDVALPVLSAKQQVIKGRVRPLSARRGEGGGSRPDSATLQLRKLGVMWQKEDVLTMQPWALDDSVKELQQRLKLKALEQINSTMSLSSPTSNNSHAAANSNFSKKTSDGTAPFLPTWQLQQLPHDRLTAFQREVSRLW